MNHIGELLVERGLISDQQLSQIDPSRELDGESLLVELDRKDYVPRTAAYEAMADEFGVEFIDLANAEVDLSLLDSFPQKIIYRQLIFPVSRVNGTLTVATADPSDYYPLDEISAATGLVVEPVLAEKSEIAKLIKTHLGVGGETIEGLVKQKIDDGVELLEELETDGSELSEMAQ